MEVLRVSSKSDRVRQSLVLAVLAGYLLMVTAASPIHRCQVNHAGSSRAAVDQACGHCCAPAAKDSGQSLDDGVSSNVEIVADGGPGHREANCFICQMLAQKYVPVGGPAELSWTEIVQEIPRVRPRAAAWAPPLPWQIRAPPCAA